MKNHHSIFEFENYKDYLKWREELWPERGMRRDLAAAMDCQPAYVSQVLNGDGHFNLEQAAKTHKFLGHTKEESHFFLLLVQMARAGTLELKNYFDEQMEQCRRQRKVLKNRLEVDQPLTFENQVTYYSDACFALTHVAVTVDALQTVHALSKRLSLPEDKMVEILEMLVSAGLVLKKNNKYLPGKTRIHLGHDSKLIQSHHKNWRLQAINNLSRVNEDDLHYSSVVSLSMKDFKNIREMLAQSIEKAKKVIRDSPAEELAVLNLDFFIHKK